MKYFLSMLAALTVFLLLSSQAWAATWTTDVTQAGAGGDCEDGGECSVAEFNALSGDYADSTFYFSGPFTTRVTPRIEGTLGHSVTLDGYKAGDCDPINAVCSSSALLQAGMWIGGNAPGSGYDYINVYDFRMTSSTSAPCFFISGYLSGSGDEKYSDYINFKRNYIYDTALNMAVF